MNIARRHRERTLARQLASGGAPGAGGGAGSPPGSVPQATGPHATGDGAPSAAKALESAMMVKLAADRARLKQVQSVEGKAALKAELIPEYAAWIEGLIIAADSLPEGEPQDVLTVVMLWAFDCDQLDHARYIARVVLARQIPLPAWIKRTAATAIAEEAAESALRSLRSTDPIRPDLLFQLRGFMDLVEGRDMPDEVRAKLFKAAAQVAEREIAQIDATGEAPDGRAGAVAALAELGLGWAQRAIQLHPACGASGTRDKLKRRLKKAAQEPSAQKIPAASASVPGEPAQSIAEGGSEGGTPVGQPAGEDASFPAGEPAA